MSTTAANIDEALNFAQGNIIEMQQTADLRARLQTWNTQALAIFSDDSVNERTVRNWLVPSARLAGEVPSGVAAASPADAEPVTDLVYRALWAAKQAESRGDITAAQLADVVTAFNNAWT